MRRLGIPEMLRSGSEQATLPRSRGFGSARTTLAQRLPGVLTPESLFRLILAFGLATALWLYVTSRNAPDASFPYPQPIAISPVYVPPGLTVRSILPSVHVNVRPGIVGLAVPPSSFAATIDLHGFGAGVYKHVPVHLSWDPSVPVVSYSPHSVAIALEHMVSEPVPVRIQLLSPPPYGYALKARSLFASPSTLRISGPRSFVAQVQSAVVSVSLGAARSSVNVNYTPVLENSQGRALQSRVTISPQRIRVHAVIQQLASFKTVPILASIHGEPSAGFGVTSIQVSPPGLTAYGAPHSLSSLQNLRTANVHVGGLRAGRKTFTVKLRVPRGVYFHTRTVSVTVSVGPVIGAASTPAAVVPVGVRAGDVAEARPGTVLVTISGPSPLLEPAGTGIRVRLNVAGLGPGTYGLAPSVRSPRGVRIISVQPSTVTVTIRRG